MMASGHGLTESLLSGNGNVRAVAESTQKDMKVRNIPLHITNNAISKNSFYTFRSLKHYFPHIKSMREFISENDYLGGLEITFQGDSAEIYSLSNRVQLDALTGLLYQIEVEIRKNITKYKGTENFKPNNVSSIFHNKVLKLLKENERINGTNNLYLIKIGMFLMLITGPMRKRHLSGC